MPKISINIVTWNSLKYLPDCLKSIKNQTFTDYAILIIDNASTDGTLEFLSKNYLDINVLKNSENFGYSAAHNQGIRLAQAEYILCMNPDIILEPEFLSHLIKEAVKNPTLGSLSGKILRKTGDLKEKGNSVKIDSTGLKIYKSRRAVNRGEGEDDLEKYNKNEEVFGHSGALVLYSKKALENVKISDEYFDEDFFAYKEDIDLAARLRLFSWHSLYIPEAIAYHYRSVKKELKRESRLTPINYYSYKNHLLWLVKNEFCSNFWCDFIFICWYELRKIIYLLIFEPQTLKSIVKFFQQLPEALKKRKIIMARKKIEAKEIRMWFQ